MPTKLTVVGGRDEAHRVYLVPTTEERAAHFRNVMGAVCTDALKVWDDIWKELQGTVTDSCMILPNAEKGFKPSCGWPEFLERIWLLRHYVDYAKRFSETRP